MPQTDRQLSGVERYSPPAMLQPVAYDAMSCWFWSQWVTLGLQAQVEMLAHPADFDSGFDLSFDRLQIRPFLTRLVFWGFQKGTYLNTYLGVHGAFAPSEFCPAQSRRDLTVSFQG